jgi:hypothetical protein
MNPPNNCVTSAPARCPFISKAAKSLLGSDPSQGLILSRSPTLRRNGPDPSFLTILPSGCDTATGIYEHPVNTTESQACPPSGFPTLVTLTTDTATSTFALPAAVELTRIP